MTRRVPRFADADGRTGVVGSGDRTLRLVVLGDSVATGYAVPHHRSTVTGALATRLSNGMPRSSMVGRRHHGVHGRRATGLVRRAAATFAEADVVFLSIGVNDTRTCTRRPASAEAGRTCSTRCWTKHPAPRCSCSAYHRSINCRPCRSSPTPSAGVGGSSIGISAQECERRDQVHRLWPANVLMREMFAGDGFHPSELLHAMFADAAIDALTPDRSGTYQPG